VQRFQEDPAEPPHKSHIPTPNSAPAIPTTRALVPCAAAVEGLVDGALVEGVVTDASGIDDGRLEANEEREIGGGTTVALTGTEVVMVVVFGGETEVTTEVIVVTVNDADKGVELPGGAMEALRLTERDTDTDPEAEGETEEAEAELEDTAAHIPSKIVFTVAWSAVLHDVVSAHCSTLDVKDDDGLHKHAVSDRLQDNVFATWLAHP